MANEHAVALGRLGGSVSSPAKAKARKAYWQRLSAAQKNAIKERISISRKAAWAKRKAQAMPAAENKSSLDA